MSIFLALGKHVCQNSQQSSLTHGGLTLLSSGYSIWTPHHMVPVVQQQQTLLPALQGDGEYVEERRCVGFSMCNVDTDSTLI